MSGRATFSIGGIDHYIIDKEDFIGSDIDVEFTNGSSTGDIIFKLGSNTSTTSVKVLDDDGDLNHMITSDKVVHIKEPLRVENNSAGNSLKRQLLLASSNDIDNNFNVNILRYSATIPAFTSILNTAYSHNITLISDNVGRTLSAGTIINGIVERSCNTNVDDTLPTPAALVAGIHKAAIGNVINFTIRNINVRSTANASHFNSFTVPAGGTFDTNDTAFYEKYIVPGQLSKYKIILTNVSSSTEAYTLWFMGAQGQRRGDQGTRTFNDLSNPISQAMTQSTVYNIGELIDTDPSVSFTGVYPTYTFFANGANGGIQNIGPPCNVSITGRLFISTDQSGRLFQMNLYMSGFPIWTFASQGGIYTEDDPGAMIEVSLQDIPMLHNEIITLQGYCLGGSATVSIYSCQLTVYHMN